MDAKDLMIGDYIMLYEDIYIIEEISSKGWAHIIYNDGSKCRVPLSTDYILGELTPIPLTPEILEKNFPDVETGVTWSETSSKGLFNIRVEYDKYVEGIFNYIHELQHALRLCGIDKEIEI